MPSSTRAIASCAACACAAILTSGCNLVGPLGFLVGGEEKVAAMYTLPADKPAVVFVDDRSSVLPSRAVRTRVAQAAERALLDGGAVSKSDVVSSEAVAAQTGAERFARPLGIAEVGQAVGAKTVVYATVDRFALSPDGVQFAPTATLRVKVVDAEQKERLWPDEPEEWQTLNVSTPVRQGQTPRNETDRARAEAELADRAGTAIGRLFVKSARRDANPKIGS